MSVTSVPIEAAPADLLDKITVLEIKSERLVKVEQLQHVRAELALLRVVRERWIPSAPDLDLLTAELRQVNERLWELEEAVRRCEAAADFSEAFVRSARSIIHANDLRAALKLAINQLLGAQFPEAKSFALPPAERWEKK